jgi:hypothetical protein
MWRTERSDNNVWIHLKTSKRSVAMCITCIKVKVKLSLGLINWSPRHEDVCGSVGIAPPFFASTLDIYQTIRGHVPEELYMHQDMNT